MSRRKKRNLKRVQLDIPEDTRETLKNMAAELEIPQSQLAALLLENGFGDVESGELDLSEFMEKSRSPLFGFVLNLAKFKKKKRRK